MQREGKTSYKRLSDDSSAGFFLTLPICKVDEEKREVWGYATTEDLDQQGEVVDYEASKTAFAEWTSKLSAATGGKSLGNIREMHQPKAVGTLIAWKPDDKRKGIYVGAKLSSSPDGEAAWQKVKEGVLTGFSIGAPSAERVLSPGPNGPINRVRAYNLSELSLVDNPACPGSYFDSIKLCKSVRNAAGSLMMVFEGLDLFQPETDTRIESREEQIMADPTATPTVEKSGKTIGPVQRPDSVEGTEQSVKPPSVTTDTTTVKPASGSKGGGVPGDDAGTSVSAPATQGKGAAAPMPPPMPAAHPEPDGDEPPVSAPPPGGAPPAMSPPAASKPQYSYCAMCGQKLAAAETFAPKCAGCGMKESSATAQAMAKAGNVAGLAKMIVDQQGAINKLSDESGALRKSVDGFEERLKKIESAPTSGGPMRTELPAGVVPVEKGGGGNDEDALIKSMDAVIAKTVDPFAKDALMRQRATLEIKKAHRG